MTEKIKILFLAACPLDSSRLRLDEELREIEKRILMAKERDRFELISQWAVTPDDLQRALLSHKPHIVHFSGHGSKTRGIVVDSPDGKSSILIDKPELIDLFKILKDNIRIIVLNACYSSRRADELSEIIDYTIGVKTAVSDADATLFATSFYQGLAHGRWVKDAFDLANNSLKTIGVAKAKLPELLVREGDPAPDPWLIPPPIPDPRRKILVIISGLVMLIAGLVVSWNYLTPPSGLPLSNTNSNINSNTNSHISDTTRAARYKEAVKQLTSKDSSITSRTDAISSLREFACDPNFDDYYEQTILTLVTYIRENSKPKIKGSAPQDKKISDDIKAALKVLGWRKHKWRDGESQRLDLSHIYLQGADLRHGTEPAEAHLEGIQLIQANLEDAMLREVNLEDAILRGANLRNATLYKANLKGADLRDADLERADLQWAKGITVAQIKEAKNWGKAYFSQEFETKLRATK